MDVLECFRPGRFAYSMEVSLLCERSGEIFRDRARIFTCAWKQRRPLEPWPCAGVTFFWFAQRIKNFDNCRQTAVRVFIDDAIDPSRNHTFLKLGELPEWELSGGAKHYHQILGMGG
jgi:hypothetical protein